MLLVLLLLSLVFLEHLAVVLNFLLKGGVDSDTATTSTTLFSEALVFFFKLSDKFVLSRFVNFGFVLDSLDLPSITKGTQSLIKVD